MSVFASILGREQKSVDLSSTLWETLFDIPTSKSGVSVNVETVLRIAAAFACVRVLAEDIAKLPLKLYQEADDGTKELAKRHSLYWLLSRQPNEWQTSFEWREMMMAHALMRKGGFSWINRVGNGRIVELIPLNPDRVTPHQRPKTLEVVYEVQDAEGTIAVLPREQVFHVQGLSWDGLSGLELVHYGREAFGLSIATEESQAKLHANGARPGGAFSTQNKLTDDQVKRIRAQVTENHGGVANFFKVLFLDNGLEFKPWAMSGVDAQHIETRKHQVEEICRLFRVYPTKIGYSDKASTYASAEQFNIAHVTDSLQPWVERWEQAISRDLLLPGEVAAGYMAKFSMQGLLRGDQKGRAAFYESAITKACWMTRNEARRLEDMDPLPGLDEPMRPLNMQSGDGQGDGAAPANGGRADGDAPADDGQADPGEEAE